ncbi:DUF669 domain-containing protein [Pediococcus acidilactici]|uniref:DUF669 domain-containing protein n=1 Tax=Pediococcus acidilactici TaxID=1254 RepID=UPI0011099C54|nr:DUF669 domain-containing protein [Pediococcus acidilactici]KAF0342528.1 DUF669 domain-containing protein [Pediococcus acidilactici]KAF0368638.1 DUF669 domain-containing protein [Pediococcus acidilactici]MDD9324211.1 DUF669 domain-containing protein [Pediococcus acidilactici]MDM5041916.1 DUF669 domain-containing protein [Pediococcus acidilactici]TLP99006.1 DUF669 domain-containing protein [Pediococcus acidilactici]
MAGFDLDFSEIKDMNVTDGKYEAVINSVAEDATKGGTQFINLDLIIRNDLKGQKFGNAHIFTRIFKSKKTNKYPIGMIMTIAKAAGMKDKTHFDSLEDYFQKLWHKPVLVTVKNEESEYNGKKYENLNVKRWEISKFPEVQHKFKESNKETGSTDPFANGGQSIDISDEDLPF